MLYAYCPLHCIVFCVKMDSKESIDLYRETPIRYLGYANEVGEAFRTVIKVKWVKLTYAVATLYVLADTADKGVQSFKVNANEKNHLQRVTYSTLDTLVWQLLASVAIPGFTINRICGMTNFLLKKSERIPNKTRKWAVTGIGLVCIPFIIKPIDNIVDRVMEGSVRRFQP